MLNFVYGTAGTGKTFFLLKEIEKKADKKRVIFLVPEPLVLSAENLKLKNFGPDSKLCVEVMSFSKLCTCILNDGSFKTNRLNESGKLMLVERLLNQNSSMLFSRYNPKMIVELFNEFRQYQVNLTSLDDAITAIRSEFLNRKLLDLAVLFEKYNEILVNKYTDNDEDLILATREVDNCSFLVDAEIYMDDFVNFVPTEYALLSEIMQKNDITISITIDDLLKPDDAFSFGSCVYTSLCNIAKDNGVLIGKTVQLTEEWRFKNNPEILHLKKSILNYNSKCFPLESENIILCCPQNYYEEVQAVAKEIIRLTHLGYSFSDIAVVFKDGKNYEEIMPLIFSEHKIKYYWNSKKNVRKNLLIRFVIYILNIMEYGFSHERVMNFLRSGFLPLSNLDIDIFENYILSVDSVSFWNSDFNISRNSNSKVVERVYTITVSAILKIKSYIVEKTYSAICNAIIKYLKSIDVSLSLQKMAANLVDNGEVDADYANIWNVLLDSLDQIQCIFGEESVSYENFLKVFCRSEFCMERHFSFIDQVMVSEIEGFYHGAKIVMLMSANSGIFPRSFKEEGLISDDEREEIRKSGINLASTCHQKQMNEEFWIYSVLTAFEDKIYIFSPMTNGEGKELRSSSIVNRVENLFPKMKVLVADSEIDSVHKLNLMIAPLKDVVEDGITPETAKKLFGLPLYLSCSKIEQYNACPFAFFMRYGLLARPRKLAEFALKDMGTFLHSILAEYFKYLEGKDYNVVSADQCRSDIEYFADKISKQFAVSSYYFKYLLTRIKSIAVINAWAIVKFYTRSKFRPFGMEISFKIGGDHRPYMIDTGIFLTGCIDRVDICEVDREECMCIVDYKLGKKKMRTELFKLGLQVQLLIYSYMLRSVKNFKPVAMLYLDFDEPIMRLESEINPEELKLAALKTRKMNGWVVDDTLKIGPLLDSGFNGGICAIPNNKSRNSLVTSQYLESQIEGVKIQIKQSANQILSGKIQIKPIFHKYYNACEYCQYHGACGME